MWQHCTRAFFVLVMETLFFMTPMFPSCDAVKLSSCYNKCVLTTHPNTDIQKWEVSQQPGYCGSSTNFHYVYTSSPFSREHIWFLVFYHVFTRGWSQNRKWQPLYVKNIVISEDWKVFAKQACKCTKINLISYINLQLLPKR